MSQQRAEYRSAKRSRSLIKKAFAKLLHSKDISKITVMDIIKEAEISRGTFYAHYPDVYGLFDQVANEEILKLNGYIQELGYEKIIRAPGELIEKVIDYINSDFEYYRMLFLAKNSNEFLQRIKNFIQEQILSNKTIALQQAKTTAEAEIFISFFLTATASVLFDWLSGTIDVTKEELTAVLSKIVTNALHANHEVLEADILL